MKTSAENTNLSTKSTQQRVLITGGSGFIGKHLVPVLLGQGFDITVFSRQPDKTALHFNHAVATVAQFDELQHQHFDIVINLAGQGITDKRWTPQIKKQLRDSRITTTRNLIDYLSQLNKKPALLISGSAIGYYGLRDSDEAVDEEAGTDKSFSSQLCLDWEAQAQQAEALGIRTCYLRTGIVLGKNGGALAKMLPAFKMGLGGPMGSGRQWMSWIHIDDLVGIIVHAIRHENITAAINATAYNPVTNKEFSSTLARVLKRPAFMPMPAFVLKLMLGQMAEELLLSGQRVLPVKMLSAAYEFQYPELETALRDIL